MAQKFFEEQLTAPSTSLMSTTSVISREEKREKFAAQGRCLNGSYLTPYSMCGGASSGVFEASYPEAFAPSSLAYKRQIRQSHVFKNKALKIEKVNNLVKAYFQYWMTMKVLNLTLGSPIDTCKIHARMSSLDDDVVIYCCRPKEEPIVGLRSCDVYFGKLYREEALEV